MKRSKVCAIIGAAGKSELAVLEEFARSGYVIAFMDPDKELGSRIKSKLKEKYGIVVRVVNEKRQRGASKKEEKADIEGFFYHGRWDKEEDVDIYKGFLEGKYGGIDRVIQSTK